MIDELRISHNFLNHTSSPSHWTNYFREAESILGSELTSLDVSDSLRRKVTSLQAAGEYVCAFGPRENSRWTFAAFREIGCELSIDLHRNSEEQYNIVNWQVPETLLLHRQGFERIKALFHLGNELLTSFYAFAESRLWMLRWGKPLRERPETTYLQRELLGVFWMTYFNAAYVEFFGKDKFSTLPSVEYGANGGATITLADQPRHVPDGLRNQVAATLGKQSFVEMDTKYLLPKRQGRYVLTFEKLRAFDAARESKMDLR